MYLFRYTNKTLIEADTKEFWSIDIHIRVFMYIHIYVYTYICIYIYVYLLKKRAFSSLARDNA
jgi:hypothetical protein